MRKVCSRTFEWRFAEPPEALWPALADTARWNEAAGLPKRQIEEVRQPDGSNRFSRRREKAPSIWPGTKFPSCGSTANGSDTAGCFPKAR